jgi:hypothetical protein
VISGIRRDSDDTQDDGALLAINLRFIVEGEYRRRTGMERAASVGALRLSSFVNPLTGVFAMAVTPAGDFEAIAV